MVYIDNILDEQDVYIPRIYNEGGYLNPYSKGYEEGFSDGRDAQKAKMVSTAFTENGIYQRENGWNEVEVDVDLGLEHGKSVELQSGDTSPWVVTPDSGYNGMDSITVVDSGYGQEKFNEGFESGSTSGYQDGVNDTKAGMSSTAFTRNDTYENPSGWSAVTVNVPKNVNLGTLVETPAMQELNNGYYDKNFVPSEGSSDGWGSVHLDLNYIIEGGKDEQKALLSSTAITHNGEYLNTNGWSAVTVDVPQTGHSCSLQTKSVQLDSGFTGTTVLPSSGYDGMSSVTISDNGYGQAKYDSGYTQGQASVALQSKNETMSAATQTFTPDSGYSGMSAVTVDASALCQSYYSSGYSAGLTGCTGGTQIIPQSIVTLNQYGVYYFIYDSATSVNNMNVVFNVQPNYDADVVAYLDIDFEADNWPLYNLSADTTNLVDIEVNGVSYSGQTYTGRITGVTYYFSDGIPDEFFKDCVFTYGNNGHHMRIELEYNNGSAYGYIGNSAFENAQITYLDFDINSNSLYHGDPEGGTLRIKSNAVKGTSISQLGLESSAPDRAGTFIIEPDAIINNNNLETIQMYTYINDEPTMFYGSASVGIMNTNQNYLNKSWYQNVSDWSISGGDR